ncbi:MAG: hypothetical protein WDO73_02045 [Ignavibacteriota bacterium]
MTNRVVLAGFLGAAALLAQDAPLTPTGVKFDLPADSPVVVMKVDTGTSRQIARGAAVVLDLNLSLTLRNIGSNRIHGITLRVVSQEVAMGGVGSVFQPGLNVGPGEVFPVRIVTKLMRPMQVGGQSGAASKSRRRAVPGPHILRAGQAAFAPHYDSDGDGVAARSYGVEASASAGRQ